jgi:hypothetical protein
MPQWKVMLAQFPYQGMTHSDAADWLADVQCQCQADPRISTIGRWKKAGTPIPALRNLCLKDAALLGYDFVLMVDSDMAPDLPYPGAEPFWPTAFNFAIASARPCVIAAPYCAAPPDERVLVSRWENEQSNHPNPDFQLRDYGRAEASMLTGIQPVAAVPAGVMLIDMRAVAEVPYPRFAYEYTDATQSAVATTEDTYFTRNLGYLGVPVYCHWSAWAGHHKSKRVGKPLQVPEGEVPAWIRRRAAELGPMASTIAEPPTNRLNGRATCVGVGS